MSDAQDARVELRLAVADDADALLELLAEPEVACWWGTYDAARVREELLGGSAFVILIEDSLAGVLLFTEEADPDYRHVSFDIAIRSASHGRGYGRRALRLGIDHFKARGHHRFTIDPAVANEPAIRSYTAAGFEPVGVMRKYARGPDGEWHDNLLMELVG